MAELQNTIKADQAAIDNAKAQLSYTLLIAPFDGITGIRLLDVGNVIQATTTSNPSALVVITQVQPISVIFTLATRTIPEVQDALARGQLETVAFSQDDNTQLDTGKLLLVDNQADPSSGTVRLKALFPNLQRQLWPGTFVNVRLVLSTQHNGLTVPLDALQQGPRGSIAGRQMSANKPGTTNAATALSSQLLRGNFGAHCGTLQMVSNAYFSKLRRLQVR